MALNLDNEFWKHLNFKYAGKIHRLERMHTPEFMGLRVIVEFRMLEDEADEIEMYRRIAKVIDVIAEGED